MKIFLFFILIQFVVNKRIESSDYCIDSKGFSKEYLYKCSDNLYSINELTCYQYKLWAMIRNLITIKNMNRKFKKFFKSIKKCPKWNPNDVCLNDEICFENILLPHRLWLIGRVSTRKESKCKCIGKYSYTCGLDNNYCSIDKGACKRLNASEINIKKCKN